METRDRIKTIDEIVAVVQQLQKNNRRVVTTNGSYDVLHVAHVRLLEKAKSRGDVLVVLINDDKSMRTLKGPTRPIVPEQERAYMLASLKPVDYVVIFPGDNPLEYLARIKPNVHVKGGSWELNRIKDEMEVVKKGGGEYETFPLETGYSTTNLIDRIISLHGTTQQNQKT